MLVPSAHVVSATMDSIDLSAGYCPGITRPEGPGRHRNECPTVGGEYSSAQIIWSGTASGGRLDGQVANHIEASFCQEVPSVFFAASEVSFGRCGFISDP
jgi:hypothetical protein